MKLGVRTKIFIIGSTYVTPGTIEITHGTTTISSDHIVITGPSPIFRISGGAGAPSTVELRAMTIGVTGSSGAGVDSEAFANVTLRDVKLEQPFACESQANLSVISSELDAGGTTYGSTTIKSSGIHSLITAPSGYFVYDSNQYSGSQRAIQSMTGQTLIMDSVFIGDGTSQSLVDLGDNGQLVYSTFVSLQPSAVPPFTCNPGLGHVAGVINAMNTADGMCITSNSLFNGPSSSGSGGNLTGPASTFFVDVTARDFHLAAGSPALHGSAAGFSGGDHDIDGAARPQPSGSAPDIGAYESPN